MANKQERESRDFKPAILLALSAHLIALSLLLNSNIFHAIPIEEVMDQSLSVSLAKAEVSPEQEAPQAMHADDASKDTSLSADQIFQELAFSF